MAESKRNIAPADNTVPSVYAKFCHPPTEIKVGYHGMIQHHFNSEAEAKEFIAWVKSVKPPLPERDNLSTPPELNEAGKYIVRLTPVQRELLSTDPMLDLSPEALDKVSVVSLEEIVGSKNKIIINFAMQQILNSYPNFLSAQYQRLILMNDNAANRLKIVLVQVIQQLNSKTLTKLVKIPAGIAHVIELNSKDIDLVNHVVNNVDNASLSDAISNANKYGYTDLHSIASHSPDLFGKVIARATPESLNAAASTSYQPNILELAIARVSPGDISAFLNKVSDQALTNLIKPLNKKPLRYIASHLLHECNEQNEALFIRLLSLAGPELTDLTCKYYLSGKSLSPTIMQLVLTKLPIQHPLHDVFENEIKLAAAPSGPMDHVKITLANNEIITLPKEYKSDEPLFDAAKKIWETGLKSYQDYHLIKKHYPHTRLDRTIDELHRAKLLFSGCKLPFRECSPFPLVIDEIAAQGNILAKVILPTVWDKAYKDSFLRQLADPEYKFRPPEVRKPVKADATHKFVHRKGVIEEYKSHKGKPKNKPPHTSIKKNSQTLLSKKLNTVLFQQFKQDAQSVGLMFDCKQTQLKAMLARDVGTYMHEHIGTLQEVKHYENAMKSVNFTDFDAFRQYVDDHPNRTNETLGKVSRDGTLAVFIANDSPQARATARQYKQDLYTECKLDVPIVFYDSTLRTFRVYSPEEQHDDDYAHKNNLSHYNTLYNESVVKVMIESLEKYIEPPRTLFQLFNSQLPKGTYESAAKKMAALLKNENNIVLTSQEFLALKSDPLARYVSDLRKNEALPKAYLEQEKQYKLIKSASTRLARR